MIERFGIDRRAQQILASLEGRPADLLLRSPDVAHLFGTSPNFLDRLRCKSGAYGTGPTVTRLGGAVRYRVSDLRRWLMVRAASWERRKPKPDRRLGPRVKPAPTRRRRRVTLPAELE